MKEGQTCSAQHYKVKIKFGLLYSPRLTITASLIYTPPIMLKSDRGTGNERFSTLPQYSLEVGGTNGPRLKNEFSRGGVYVTPWADELLDRLQKPERQEQVSLVKFSLRDVGIRDYASGSSGWEKVVKAVQKEGLALCPQLTAPEMARLNADIIGQGEYVDILSKPITDRSGYQGVFELRRYGGELELGGSWHDHEWGPGHLAVARLR